MAIMASLNGRLACVALAAFAGCTSAAENPADRQPKTAVQEQDYTFTPKAERKYGQVRDPAAPTIGQLKARGLKQSGWDADMYSCGPACDAVYAYAIFFGNRRTYPAKNEHLYTCPNPEKAMAQDEWRCTKFAGIRNPRNG